MIAAAAPAADTSVNGTALTIVIILFLGVTVVGFMASRWRRAATMDSLDEWGLGGRGFGNWVTWFLIGGDIYTAYTFIAVPAAMFATGAVSGFFAVPYTIVLYPIIFIFMSRLWSVSHRHGYVTPADFVGGRYGSKSLSLAVACTGILATMPYIALQLVGIQAVLEVMGLGGSDNIIEKDLPLFIAFAVLAAYTYSSGLRAPALIAFVKDTLIYLVIFVAVVYLPSKFGGWDAIFGAAEEKMTAPNDAPGAAARAFIPGDGQYMPYWTLALGSAMALFMYPHSITAVLSTKNRNVVRRNASILPAYSLLLGLLALLGFVAIAAGTSPIGLDGVPNAAARDPAAVRGPLPGVVRRGRVRRDRDRRPRAGRDHVDRSGEPVHPQHLPRLHQARRDSEAGGAGLQDRLARGQARRAGVRPLPRPDCSASTSSCSAGSGSCRRSRRSCSACSRAGSTGGRCSPAGRSA